jgi:hypothetical protein
MKSFFSSIAYTLGLFFILSCNVYSPLNSNNSDLDKLEEAQKCLKDSDYACAINQYKNLSDATLKNQKLCQAYLSKGGVTLSVLVKEINQSSSKMLSGLARALAPWDAQKSEDLDYAKTYCVDYSADGSSEDLGVLFKTLAVISHCSIRVAKANLFQATSNGGACNQTLLANGTLDATDIAINSNGKIADGAPGMCSEDVDACGVDLTSVTESQLTSSGFDKLAGALHNLPTGYNNSDTDKIRAAIRGTF